MEEIVIIVISSVPLWPVLVRVNRVVQVVDVDSSVESVETTGQVVSVLLQSHHILSEGGWLWVKVLSSGEVTDGQEGGGGEQGKGLLPEELSVKVSCWHCFFFCVVARAFCVYVRV